DSDGDGVSDSQDIDPLDPKSNESKDNLVGYQILKVLDYNFIFVSQPLENIIRIQLYYSTNTKDDMLEGLKLSLEYNSEQLEFLGFSDVLEHSHEKIETLVDTNDEYQGNHYLYNKETPIKWASSLNNWPMMPLPTKLVTARFKLKDIVNMGEVAWVQISSDKVAKGYMLKPIQFKIKVTELEGISSLDLGDTSDINKIKLLTRALIGMEGFDLLGKNRGTAEQANGISEYVKQSFSIYDIDGDGEVNPLVDSVLLYRYFKGTLKEEDVALLINEHSTRRTLIEIEDAIKRVLAL
ncbi:MAG: hypothetical protein QM493_04575, partial [Sulfurovum sp.]